MTRTPVEKATFTPQSGPDTSPLTVDFNPVSLQYSVSNSLKEEGSGKSKKQFITQSTAKLTMDLVFDNTDYGVDVRLSTSRISGWMAPDPKSAGTKKQVAVVVLFEWGSYKFQGMLESYKETLDFFAPEGVPLRATVNITMAEQDKVLLDVGVTSSDDAPPPDAVDVPTDQFDPTAAANRGGNPDAARGIAALNGQASLRFGAGASLTLTGAVTLGPPSAFATGGAGIGIGAGAGFGIGGGAGIGIGGGAGFGIGAGAGIGASASAGFGAGASAGFGAGASAGFGASASAGFGASASAGFSSSASFSAGSGGFAVSSGGALFGSSASAGVTASQGAFSGLRVSTSPTAVSVDTDRFLRVSESVSISTSGSDFGIGGQVIGSGKSALSTDVGANVDLRARIQFEVE